MTLTGYLTLVAMQVSPNPAIDHFPEAHDDLRNRPPREGSAIEAQPAVQSRLSQCLSRARADPQGALDFAQAWRETSSDSEMAQTSHCAGLALVQLGRFSEAQSAFKAARDEAGSNPAYRARLGAMAGHAALANDDAEGALPEFEFAAADALASGDPLLRAGIELDRAAALVGLQRDEDAVRPLAQARTLAPENARAWLLSATLSRRLGRLGEAQEQIERAAALTPSDPLIGLEAGVIAASSGRFEDARRSFESVIALAPSSEEAERSRAYLVQLAEGEAEQ